jgi:hypothetical protein
MSGKLVLQIFEEDVPLTQIGAAKIIMGMKDKHLREIANTGFRGEPRIPKYCNNKDHHHYNACIGGGICLAKKYKRLFSFVDLECVSCESTNIVTTLNYMFDEYYSGRYRAEWRKPRGRRATIEKEKVFKKRGKKEEPAQVPDEIKQEESITKKNSPKKKPERKPRAPKVFQTTETGRVSCITPNESNVPKEGTKPAGRGKPRVKQGRPRNRKAEVA